MISFLKKYWWIVSGASPLALESRPLYIQSRFCLTHFASSHVDTTLQTATKILSTSQVCSGAHNSQTNTLHLDHMDDMIDLAWVVQYLGTLANTCCAYVEDAVAAWLNTHWYFCMLPSIADIASNNLIWLYFREYSKRQVSAGIKDLRGAMELS